MAEENPIIRGLTEMERAAAAQAEAAEKDTWRTRLLNELGRPTDSAVPLPPVVAELLDKYLRLKGSYAGAHLRILDDRRLLDERTAERDAALREARNAQALELSVECLRKGLLRVARALRFPLPEGGGAMQLDHLVEEARDRQRRIEVLEDALAGANPLGWIVDSQRNYKAAMDAADAWQKQAEAALRPALPHAADRPYDDSAPSLLDIVDEIHREHPEPEHPHDTGADVATGQCGPTEK